VKRSRGGGKDLAGFSEEVAGAQRTSLRPEHGRPAVVVARLPAGVGEGVGDGISSAVLAGVEGGELAHDLVALGLRERVELDASHAEVPRRAHTGGVGDRVVLSHAKALRGRGREVQQTSGRLDGQTHGALANTCMREAS
jgi:hypothetical protein